MACHLVAAPYPGRGHINPMINLCCSLLSTAAAADGLLIVTLVVTDEWLGLIDPAGTPPNLHLRCIPDVLPSERHRGADVDAFLQAVLTRMEAPFEELLGRLRPTPTAILADTLLPWAADVGRRRGLPLFSLWTQAPSRFAAFYHFDLLFTNPLLQGMPGVKPSLAADLRSACSDGGSVAPRPIIVESFRRVVTARCLLLTSPGELEPDTIEALRRELPFPVLPMGPCIPTLGKALQAAPPPTRATSESADAAAVVDYLSWLDTQPTGSVLYVSLGSFMRVSRAQMDEIGMGLQESGVRYLWAARGDSAVELHSVDSAANGLLVPWCDQPGVLRHRAVGGFLTHCGWNSTVEALCAGVPMLAFPLGLDQFWNSNLVVDEWKVGLRVKSRAGGDSLVGRAEIAGLARMLMDPSEAEGLVRSRGLRARARELMREVCRGGALGRGGSSARNLEGFVNLLVDSDACPKPGEREIASGANSPPEEEGKKPASASDREEEEQGFQKNRYH